MASTCGPFPSHRHLRSHHRLSYRHRSYRPRSCRRHSHPDPHQKGPEAHEAQEALVPGRIFHCSVLASSSPAIGVHPIHFISFHAQSVRTGRVRCWVLASFLYNSCRYCYVLSNLGPEQNCQVRSWLRDQHTSTHINTSAAGLEMSNLATGNSQCVCVGKIECITCA